MGVSGRYVYLTAVPLNLALSDDPVFDNDNVSFSRGVHLNLIVRLVYYFGVAVG